MTPRTLVRQAFPGPSGPWSCKVPARGSHPPMLSSHAPVPARPWRENKAEKSGGPMTAIAKLLERWHYAWHWTFAIHLVHLNPRWLGMDPSRSITDQDRPRYSQGVTEKGCKFASATPGGGHTTWKVLMAFTGSSLPDHWIMMAQFCFLESQDHLSYELSISYSLL